jgi:CRP-like cAMP-binding protein
MPLSNPSTLAADPRSKFLEGFSPLDHKVILAAARLRHFTSNSVIANQCSPADHMFLVTKGRARFFINTQEGKKIILHWLTPGEIFGGAALMFTASRLLSGWQNNGAILKRRGKVLLRSPERLLLHTI